MFSLKCWSTLALLAVIALGGTNEAQARRVTRIKVVQAPAKVVVQQQRAAVVVQQRNVRVQVK